MHPLSAPELLRVWESGIGQTPVNRALSLLEAAYPEATIPLEQLTIGQRDSLLLTLREQMFGERLESVVECPQCGRVFHQNDAAGDSNAKQCWTYRPQCLCSHPTSLSGDTWRPELEELQHA